MRLSAILAVAAIASAARAGDPPAGRRGFFVFFAAMLDDPKWPADYRGFQNGVVILDPFGASAATVSTLKKELNATVLLYWDFGDLRSMHLADGVVGVAPLSHGPNIGCSGESCCDHIRCAAEGAHTQSHKCGDDDYNRELRSVLNVSWAIHRILDNGTRLPICTDETGPNYIPFPPSIEAIAAFLARKVPALGVDGVYLDGRGSSFMFSRAWPRTINASGWKFDIDGDGKPDTYMDMVAQFAAYAPLFTATLRARLGSGPILVGNSAGALSDPMLRRAPAPVYRLARPRERRARNARRARLTVRAHPPTPLPPTGRAALAAASRSRWRRARASWASRRSPAAKPPCAPSTRSPRSPGTTSASSRSCG